MSSFFQEAEQAAQSFEGQGNSNSGSNDNNNQQQDQGNNQQQDSQQTQQKSGSSGGGFLAGAEQAGEDGALNTELNSFATKEGLPAGADGAMDAFVDKEANQYLGGNKNF